MTSQPIPPRRGRAQTPLPLALPCLALLIWTAAATAQQVSSVILQPTQALVAGTKNVVWLCVVNDSPEEVTVKMPATRRCRVEIAGQAALDTQIEAAPGASPQMTVSAASFGKREYWLNLPPGVTGEATLELPDPGWNEIKFAVVNPVASPGGSTTAQPTAANAAAELAAAEPPGSFLKYFSPYEPIYFIAGSQQPTARFQVSLKYHMLDPDGAIGRTVPGAADIYFGYTQTALWNITGPSSPFFDTSYKPGVFIYRRDIYRHDFQDGIGLHLDAQGGYQHESNGRDGAASRSMNTVYVQPTLRLGEEDKLYVTLTPRAWAYVFDLSDNPDIQSFRGYADLTATIAWNEGWQLRTLFRIGDTGSHGTLQFDLTYPLHRLGVLGGLTPYAHAQYFRGYGESFLGYNQHSDVWRVGLSLYR